MLRSTVMRLAQPSMGGGSASGLACRAWDTLQAGLSRSYSSEPDNDQQASSSAPVGNEKVQKLAQDIMNLTVLEASWLSEILRKKLNMPKPAFGAAGMIPMMAAGPAPPQPAAGAAAAAPAAEAKKEKTEFDLKLESFSAEGKIKVIKEVRAITNLGLKEAKELVEKAPVVIKGSIPKAEAESLKKQLETAGGKVSIA